MVAVSPCESFQSGSWPCANDLRHISKSKKRKLRDRRVAVRRAFTHAQILKEEVLVKTVSTSSNNVKSAEDAQSDFGDAPKGLLLIGERLTSIERCLSILTDYFLSPGTSSTWEWEVLLSALRNDEIEKDYMSKGIPADVLKAQCTAVTCIQRSYRAFRRRQINACENGSRLVANRFRKSETQAASAGCQVFSESQASVWESVIENRQKVVARRYIKKGDNEAHEVSSGNVDANAVNDALGLRSLRIAFQDFLVHVGSYGDSPDCASLLDDCVSFMNQLADEFDQGGEKTIKILQDCKCFLDHAAMYKRCTDCAALLADVVSFINQMDDEYFDHVQGRE